MRMLEGKVIHNFDPEGMGKLFVNIPKVHSLNQGIWAKACLPGRSFQLPACGEFVWCVQTYDDSREYVWMGHSPRKCVENYAQNIAERNGTAPVMELKPPSASNPRSSVIEKRRTEAEIKANPRPNTLPDRHTVLKTPGGITIFADDNVLNNRYQGLENPVDLRKKMHTLLTKDDDFHWGIEDPLGNVIVLEHLEGHTYLTFSIQENTPDKRMALVFNTRTQEFSIVSKDFEISHSATTKEMFIRDINKNTIHTNEEGIELTAKDGAGDIKVSCVNADGDIEPLVLGNQLKDLLDKLYTALNQWIPMPSDGGAALKTALAPFLTLYGSYQGSKTYLTQKAG